MDTKDVIETLEDLLSIEDVRRETVEFNGKMIHLASVSAAEMFDYTDEQDGRVANLRLVAWSLVNSKGERIGKLEDVEKIRAKSPALVLKLIAAAKKVNGVAGQPKEDAKKDSDVAPPVASSIG